MHSDIFSQTSLVAPFFLNKPIISAAANSPSHGISEAKVILEEMERFPHSAPKDLRTANAFMFVCEASGDWELALATLNALDHERLRQQAPRGSGTDTNSKTSRALAWVPDFPSNLTPDSFSFNTALGACREAGQREAANGLLQRMKDFGPRPDEVCSSADIEVNEHLDLMDRFVSKIGKTRR